jgi:Zn-dependent membrane protease YugP
MPFIALLGLLIVLAIFFGPSLWARWVLRRHASHRPDFPGTGGELARHLLDEVGLGDVASEETPQGSHYSPDDKAVRLSPDLYNAASLSAVAAAAHEVAHALQDRDGYAPLRTRTRLIKAIAPVQRIGAFIVAASPVLGLVTLSPAVGLLTIVAGIATMASAVVVHLVTLPMEFDASFNRALPILDRGGYLPAADMAAARQVLLACALTYVAAALASLLNLFRWVRLLR